MHATLPPDLDTQLESFRKALWDRKIAAPSAMFGEILAITIVFQRRSIYTREVAYSGYIGSGGERVEEPRKGPRRQRGIRTNMARTTTTAATSNDPFKGATLAGGNQVATSDR
jgi:hypothetical protein